jgi:hypothetical protein
MAKTNLSSDWSTNGELIFSANASGSGAMVFNVATPLILGALAYPLKSIDTKTSANNYSLSVTHLLGGVISDTTTGNAISVTLPTVANVCAVIPGWQAGTSFTLFYRNPGDQAITLYTDASSQWTILGTNTIAAANCKQYDFVIATAATGTVICKGSKVA